MHAFPALIEDDETGQRPITPKLALQTQAPTAAAAAARSGPVSPIRFAASTSAFGLASPAAVLPTASVFNREPQAQSQSHTATSPVATTSPPTAGTLSTRRLRRPSLLSLTGRTDTPAPAPTTVQDRSVSPTSMSLSSATGGPGMGQPSHVATTGPTQAQPLPRWGVAPFTSLAGTPTRTSSAPPIPIEGLTTSTSPAPPLGAGRSLGENGGDDRRASMAMDTDETARSPLKWLPTHLQARRFSRGKELDGDDSAPLSGSHPPFQGRPLPGALLATLISEHSPLEHEMRSEARLQRLITSHPSALPLTPRQRRNMRGSRGRFPEMVGGDDDDDDDDFTTHRLSIGSRWRAASSDTDSDDMMEDMPIEWQNNSAAGAVNSAFASVMDLDRPASSGSSSAFHRSGSGTSTPGGSRANPTPPGQTKNGNGNGLARVAPSPGTGLQLPVAFGTLGMSGSATPLGSPTVEKAELAASPTAMSVASPGMMQYRDPPPTIRSGKRKAAAEERFDPYKRPRGGSPSPFQNAALSPSKSCSIPIPSSPSHVPLVTSSLAMGSPGYLSLAGSTRPAKPSHPYTRPMASRSRAASPALSIGSTSGVLSSSIGTGGLTGPSRPLGGPFIPAGQGASAAVNAAAMQGAAPPSLGSLGLLSLGAGQFEAQVREAREQQEAARYRDRDAMEED